MRKTLLSLVSLVVLFTASCSEDFDIAAPYKTITVVFGMLNVSDTAHYVRIQKAFLDQTKSALDMAKIPDSSNFTNLSVVMKELDGGVLVNTYALAKVDMNLEGYQKDTGQFYTSPNYAYKFKAPLNAKYTYRLVIFNPATGETDSSETPVIDPSGFQIPIFTSSSYTIDISQTTYGKKFSLGGTAPANAFTIEGTMRFHWIDKDPSGNLTPQYGDWPYSTTTVSSSGFSLDVLCSEVYYGIRNTMGAAESGHVRYIDSCDIILWTAGQAYSTYQSITQTQANSLSSDEIKPNYTNMKGKNVLGLFTCRTMVQGSNIAFSKISIDSIKASSVTAPCNIIGSAADL